MVLKLFSYCVTVTYPVVSKTKPFLSLSRASLLRSISWCSLLYLYQTNLTAIILSHLILILFSEELPDVHSCGRTTDFFLRKYNLEGIDKNVSNGRLGFYKSVKNKFHFSIIGDTKTCL